MEENSSGYTEDVAGEVMRGAAMRRGDGFVAVQEVYDSPRSGVRLFSAVRYGRLHILKAPRPGSEADPLVEMMLRKEFEVGIALDHPNVRRTVGFEHVAGVGECLVLEYVDGVTLAEAMRRGMLTRDNVRQVVRQLAEAVAYLHSKQVIHRDLKPANVMLTYTGSVVKLIDFSMADGGGFSVLKQPGGTRGYMAPEQEQPGAPATVEADIYSLGRIVGELAEGVGDAELKEMAARCCRHDASRRPHSIAATGLLTLPPRERRYALSSPRLTRLLTVIAVALALIFVLLITI